MRPNAKWWYTVPVGGWSPREGVVPMWVFWVFVVVAFWFSMGSPNFFVRGGSF